MLSLGRVCSVLALTLCMGAWAQPFLPAIPLAINTNAAADSGNDAQLSLAVDAQGVVHAVWSSDDAGFGTGNDDEIYYTRNGGSGWTAPQQINSAFAGIDGGAADFRPRVAVGPDGTIHCVWVSGFSYQGAGADNDVLYSQRCGPGWSAPELVDATYAVNTGGQDFDPSVTVGLDGTVHVAWSADTNLNLGGTIGPIGTDFDLLYATRTAGGWSNVTALNSEAGTDGATHDDATPVLTTMEDGTILVAWSSNVPTLTSGTILGADFDILYALLPSGGSWSNSGEVCSEMRTDPVPPLQGDDVIPAVVAVGANFESVRHFAWMSDSGVWGNGNDFDVIHCALGSVLIFPTTVTAAPVNSSALVDTVIDFNPQLIAEPGGVVHCFWDSTHNLITALGPTGNDSDVYHSSNGSDGPEWSDMTLVNLNGLFDNALVNNTDSGQVAVRAPSGALAVGWRTNDPHGGAALGTDFDLVGAVGFGRLTAVPELVNTSGYSDNPVWPFDSDSFPDVAFAPDGTLHAVWSSIAAALTGAGDADIFHSTLTGTGWSVPTRINGFGFADAFADTDLDPALFIDSQGTLHVTWASNFNLNSTAGTDFDILYSSSSNGGQNWSTPQLINTTGTGDATSDDVEPCLMISQAGTIHVAWSSQANIQNAGINDIDIAYASNGGGGWSAAELVNSAYGTTDGVGFVDGDFNPSLALDSNGDPHIAWFSQVNHAGAGNDGDIFHSARTGGSWSNPVLVNTTGAADGAEDVGPVLAFTPDGNPHVAWASNLDLTVPLGQTGVDADIFLSSRIGGNWSAPTLVNSFGTLDITAPPLAAEYDLAPDMVSDAGGALHIVWEGNHNFLGTAGNDGDIFYAAATSPTTLTPSILANPNGHGDFLIDTQPVVAMDREGRAHFAWTSQDGVTGFFGNDEDILHGHSDLPALATEAFADQDLSAWAYNGAAAAAGALGPSFPGDAQVTGTAVADDDADGSVSDLDITFPSQTGMSFVTHASSFDAIPFRQDASYLIRATISSDIAADAQKPDVRFRWGYTPLSSLGGGAITASGLGGIAPAGGGTTYTLLFDALDVGTTGTFPFGTQTLTESDVTLFFDTVDFSNTEGGGTVELDEVEITRLSRQALRSIGLIEVDVTDFSDTQVVAATGGLSAGGAITVTQQPCQIDLVAPVANTTTGTDLFGNPLSISFNGAGLVPFVPTGWPAQRRFYRARFAVGHTATPAQPIPRFRMSVATFQLPAQVYTAEAWVNPLAQSLPGQLNPALAQSEYSAYLHLPDTASLGPGQAVGDRVAAHVQVIDESSAQGGTLTLRGLTLFSYPETVLP